MRRSQEPSPLARQYQQSLSNDDDAVREFADTVLTVEAFQKVFRKRARELSERFVERLDVVPPRSTEAVHRKYTDAYLQHIYDGLRLNCAGDVLTWQALHNYLIDWEDSQYGLLPPDQSTETNDPDGSSPSE